MRKLKKINGYLVVRFNDREKREYEGTGLGNFGVIDAELYTGILDVDRGVMEYRVACTRKEASCILGNFFSGLSQVCESCQRRPRDELALITRDGLKLTGEASLTIEGRSSITGEPATVKLTDYGFEFYGDIAEIERIRKGRCVGYGGTVYPAEEG